MNYVYWIHDDTCKDVKTDGYVGVTYDPDSRYKAHLRKNNRVHEETNMVILFEGSREECFELERELRPTPGIGWNLAVGGSHGWQTGFNHSEETKQKMKDAWTDERKEIASKLKTEQNRRLKGQKRPKQSESISGENNGMFGNNHSEESRMKMSKSRKGKEPSNKLEYYCIYCHERGNPTVFKKYHGLGKKRCKALEESND